MKKRTVFLLGFVCVLYIAMSVLGPRETLDMKLYYSGDQARALLSTFDHHELQAYFINELFDLLLIFSYTALFYIALRKMFSDGKNIPVLAVIPGAFDLIETTLILFATKVVGPHAFFDWLGIVTFLKWTTGAALMIPICYSFLRGLLSNTLKSKPSMKGK